MVMVSSVVMDCDIVIRNRKTVNLSQTVGSREVVSNQKYRGHRSELLALYNKRSVHAYARHTLASLLMEPARYLLLLGELISANAVSPQICSI